MLRVVELYWISCSSNSMGMRPSGNGQCQAPMLIALKDVFFIKSCFYSLFIIGILLYVGDEFSSRLDTLMTQALRKGVPPLFNNLRSLYRDRDKVQTSNYW